MSCRSRPRSSNTAIKHAGERPVTSSRCASAPAPGRSRLAAVLLGDRRARHDLRGRPLELEIAARLRCEGCGASGAGHPGVPLPGLRRAARSRSPPARSWRSSTSRSGSTHMHRTKVRIVEDALDANNTIARANRDDFDRHGVTVVNLMSAPGAGKTALLERALARAPRTGAVGVLEGDVQGSIRRRPARELPRPGRPAQHRQRLRRRVPSRRQHGPLGARIAAARRARPARDRERREPRLPGRVQGRRGRPGDGLLGDRGRGQAAQVPADVPRLRARGRQQARPAAAPRLRPRSSCCTTSMRSIRASSGSSTSARTGEGVEQWTRWLLGAALRAAAV
jgi:hypothetical protein